MGSIGANRNGLSVNGLSAADQARLNREVEAELNALPAPVTRVSVPAVDAAAQDAGLERVRGNGLTDSDIGSTFVITQPIMRTKMSSRTDPDSVEFLEAVYTGRSSGVFAIPLFQVGYRTIRVEDNEPYASIYRRRRG